RTAGLDLPRLRLCCHNIGLATTKYLQKERCLLLHSIKRVCVNWTIKVALTFALAATAWVGLRAEPVQLLRIYQVPTANEEVFHQRFRDEAMPIMLGYGFDFIGTWRSQHESQTEFVYLLSWPDKA